MTRLLGFRDADDEEVSEEAIEEVSEGGLGEDGDGGDEYDGDGGYDGDDGKSYLIAKKEVQYPFQIVPTDHVGPLPTSNGGYQYIMTALCTYTRMLVPRAVRTQTAVETANTLLDGVIAVYGSPTKVISD
jgi:hypothetical protein